jgi:glycosyltransferase involved in cell wall biosynthesis
MRAGGPRVLSLTVGFGIGGAEQLLLAVLPRLAERGFDVRAAALKGPGPMRAELEAAGVPCTALGGAGRRDPRVLFALAAHLRRERIDILHTHNFLANVAGRIAGRLAGVPVIVSAHHDTDVWMKARHRLVERLTARLSDRIVACSDEVRDFAIRRIGLSAGHVMTLRNALAPMAPVGAAERAAVRAELGLDAQDLVAGTLGRLYEPKKGLAVFLEAAARVADAVPRARFVLAGDGPAREALERRAAEPDLAGRVRFAGARRDVHRLLAAYDLFVQPSLWEGFGLTVLEAMAMERAVVATAVGGQPGIVRDGIDGVLVPPGDPRALAAAVTALLGDAGRRTRSGSAGRARALAEFPIERLVDETAALYDALLERRAPWRAHASEARAGRRVA